MAQAPNATRRETGQAATQPKTGHGFARSLDWNLLKIFHEIVEARGISEAARHTSRTQPAVSMALRRLEEQVGARLCRRGPGGFEVTREGDVLAALCAQMFVGVADISGRISDQAAELRGRVRVQLISNLTDSSIDRAFESFHAAHPDVELFVSVSTWDVIRRSVLRSEAEIGIAPAHHKDPRLRYELLFREIYRPFCGRGHPLFGTLVDGPQDLAGEGLILTGADEPDELMRFRTRHAIGRHVAGLSEHLEEAKRLALLGVGICFLPESLVAREVTEGKLHAVLARGNDPSSSIYMISNPAAPTHQASEVLLDYLRRQAGPER
ncbi:MAG: LysR family transcriptional regulator [Rhodospirillaceae bacterium]|nr:LysR family transcriptional regulator [Rhodospirillaceae bacterium]